MAGFWESILAPFTGKPIEDAAKLKEQGIRTGLAEQAGKYGTGRDVLTDYYTRALQPFMDLQGAAGGGYQAYADATGANGPEGLARARQNFQAGPGFNFALDQGVNAINRSGVARGAATGNILRDAQTFGSGLANQEWGNYVNRLAPWLGQGTALAGSVSDINRALGGELSRSYTGEGDAAARAYGAIGDVQGQAAMSPYLAGQNIWGLLMQGAKIAAGAAGGAGMGAGGMGTGGMGLPKGNATGGLY
jgi:hypothetical protein